MDKITASLTTVVERTEALKETVASLLPQVDKLNVFLHGYRELPEFLQHEKIEVAFDLEWGDKGDLDKFSWCDELEGYHLVCDDDLIYPTDYAQKMIEKIDKYQCLVSFHGVIPFNPPIASYYLDRHVFPCLGTVAGDMLVPIGGTGVMGYHTSHVPLKDFVYKDLIANMADVHIAVWAAENKVPIMVLEHQEGWIKYTTYVKDEDTIFGKTIGRDWYPTDKINANAKYFATRKVTGTVPLVSIVCVNTRMYTNNDWVREAYASFREQDYPDIEVIIIENTDKMITIGKAFNEGVKAAHGEFVLFVGDDDLITFDYVGSLVNYYNTQANNPKVIGVTSFLTMFRVEDGKMKSEPRELIPTGMWKRSWLLENPFKEYLTKYVDTELMESAKEQGFLYPPCIWHYGYFYRSHEKQVSGHKALATHRETASHRTDDVKQKIKKVVQ